MPPIDLTLPEIAAFLKERDRFLILCHHRPDGDTLGSGLALLRMLSHLGKRACLLCADPPPPNLRFLFPEEDGLPETPENGFCRGDRSLLTDPEATAVAVDVASLGQLGQLAPRPIALRIDHHAIGEAFGDRQYVDEKAAACGEILFALANLLGVPTAKVAEPLYAALSTDTGGFRYANTTPRTMRMAASLLEAGADGASLSRALYESRTPSEIRALVAAYQNLTFYCQGRVAVIVVTNALRRQYELSESDLSLFSAVTREPAGVVIGINIRQNEKDPAKFRLSVRSAPGYPANKVCTAFGGGGHAGVPDALPA